MKQTMRAIYDFSGGERGKHAERYRQGRLMPGDRPRQDDEGQPSWPEELGRDNELCTAGKPLLMLIPPGGATIGCPVHPEGHRVYEPPATRC